MLNVLQHISNSFLRNFSDRQRKRDLLPCLILTVFFFLVSSGKAPRLKCFAKSDTPSKTETETDEYNLKKSNMTIDDLHKLPSK